MTINLNSSLLSIEKTSEEYLNSYQLSCSQMIQSFVIEASNPLNLLSLVLGGAIARTVELTCFRSLINLSNNSVIKFSRSFSHFASLVGVTTEAGFFAAVPMLEKGESLTEFGIGTAHGTFVIGLCRVVGSYTHSSFLINCFAQDVVVMGVDVTFETFNLREVQNVSGVERWFHARAIAFQMHISGQICNTLPGVAANQARFTLEKTIHQNSFSSSKKSSSFFHFGFERELVTSTGVVISENSLSRENRKAERIKRANIIRMVNNEESGRTNSRNHEFAGEFKKLMEKAKEGDSGAIDTLRAFIEESEDEKIIRLASTALSGAVSHPDSYSVLEELAKKGEVYSPICQIALNRSQYSGGLFGIDLRDYQITDIAELVEAIESGKDRYLKRNPWQTGKSLSIGPSWEAVRKYFKSGSICLVITPFVINKEQILGDVSKNELLRIGVIDGDRKDFGPNFDYVIASSHALAFRENLDRFDPDLYSFVIYDEAGTIQSRAALKILIELGFLDTEGKIKQNREKFLYGLTADQHSLESVFGKEVNSSPRDLAWFINKGYLHRPIGTRIPYKNYFPLQEIRVGKTQILTPPNVEEYYDEVFQLYKQRLMGERTLIKAGSVLHAIGIADYFNRKTRLQKYAMAVYSYDSTTGHRMSKLEFDDAIDRFNQGETKVLVYDLRLAHSLRARMTRGVIVACEISSSRLYGQVVGRPLGVEEQNGVREQQREVLIFDMKGKGPKLFNPATLPRLGKLLDYQEDHEPVDLLKVLNALPTKYKPRPKMRVQAIKPRAHQKGILEFVYVEEGDKGFMPEFFPSVLNQVLEKNYSNNLERMAKALQMDLERVERYLYGELPRSLEEVRHIAAHLKIPEKRLLIAWENDFLKIVEAIHPMDKAHGPYARRMIEILRLSCLYLGTGTIKSAHAVCPDINYYDLVNIFRGGKFRVHSPRFFFELFTLIRRADLIPIERVRRLRDRAYREIYQKRKRVRSGIEQYNFEKDMFLYGLDPRVREDRDPHLFIDHQTQERLEGGFLFSERLIKTALATLLPREAEAISLRFRLNEKDSTLTDEMPTKEIGKKIGLTEGGASELLRRTAIKLRWAFRASQSSNEYTLDYSWVLTKIPQNQLKSPLSANEVMNKIDRFLRSSSDKSREVFQLHWVSMIRCIRMLEQLNFYYRDSLSRFIIRRVFYDQNQEFHLRVTDVLKEYIKSGSKHF